VRRWNARRRSPSFRAIQNAGPPTAWLAVAGAAGLFAVVGLYVLGIHDRTTLIAVPFIALVAASVIDRDGWRIRLATGELADAQRRRWTWGRPPADQLSAETWLSTHVDAPLIDRASVLVTAGRPIEARVLLGQAVATTPEETVRLERMRLTIEAGLGEAALDEHAIDAFTRLPELAAISAPERRYHQLSLAWSMAWFQIHGHRPWRTAFADALRTLGPFRPPLRYLVFHAIQQLALPIAYLLAWLILGWLGIVDWLG